MNPAPRSDEDLQQILNHALNRFEIAVSRRQLEQLAAHFLLLLKWRDKISLTSLREPEEMALRHFAESLYLTRILDPFAPNAKATCIDVGSGAGFPGLPLAIAWPLSQWVMLEPNQKKVAFLKEAIRATGIQAQVRALRLEDAVGSGLQGKASLVTIRAVSVSAAMLEDLARLLKLDGSIALYLGSKDSADLIRSDRFTWNVPSPLPNSDRRTILIGRLRK